MKILIAIDGSEHSKQSIAEIARRAWHPGTEVKIIHVIESSIPSPLSELNGIGAEKAKEKHRNAIQCSNELLDAMANTIRKQTNDGVSISTDVITDSHFHSPEQEIVDEAARFDADLLVIGSRGLSAWKSLLLGSVSTAVSRNAPCSVEIVRVKKDRSATFEGNN